MTTAATNPATVNLYSRLEALGVLYKTFEHPPVQTIEDLLIAFPGDDMVHIKNLFLADKKKRFYVVSTPAASNVNLKVLAAKLDAPQCRFATEEKMQLLLGVEPGAVTPLASINDKGNAVTFVLDEVLRTEQRLLLVHPLVNTSTISISVDDLAKVMSDSSHDIKWVDFSHVPSNVIEGDPPAKSAKASDKSAPAPVARFGTEMLGITAKKQENFGEWYTQVITRSELVDYYDISGCYIIRPNAFYMWETVQEFINSHIKKLGVQNCYFPMFVAKHRLETEKKHVEGFSAEVAWVTKYGDTDLVEPIAIRPTSETIMYPAFAKWIRSHRDLPLKLNQWNQVVRWEFKQPTPFIRTREFLWQEGHTAHSTDAEASAMVFQILDIYSKVFEELLAVPVIKGVKSEGEKFAGGKMTSTIEAFIQSNGRAVQAATSHHLGTNFSKMFGIEFEGKELGVAVMVHGDDSGMVMPPRVAPIQVVLVPITYKDKSDEEMHCRAIERELTEANIRVKVDDRENYTPGWKYNDWETKGVCIRLELGPRDVANNSVRLVRRDNNSKSDISRSCLLETVQKTLEDIHKDLFAKAKKSYDDSIVKVSKWEDVMPALNARKLVLAPWCEDPESEEEIKKETLRLSVQQQEERDPEEGGAPALTGSMKPLCIPLDQPPMPGGTLCFFTKKPAKRWCLFGRSY